MPSLMIIEPNADGHRMQYVRRLVRQVACQGIVIQLATRRDSLRHSAYQAMAQEVGADLETILLPSRPWVTHLLQSPNLFDKQIAYYWLFSRAFQALPEKPDAVFVPYLDYCDKLISILGSPFGNTPWGGLLMQIKFHYPKMGALKSSEKGDQAKERAFLRLFQIKTLTSLFTVDELLYQYVRNHHASLLSKFHNVNDPVDMVGDCSREAARSLFGIPDSRFVLLLFGALALRKGIAELMAAMQDAEFPKEVCLLLVGKQGPDVLQLLARPGAEKLRSQKRLLEMDRFVDDATEYAAFKAADAVWIGYRNFHIMSGVLIQAAKMGLPVVACEAGLIGWMTHKYELGIPVEVTRRDQVAAAIRTLYEDPALARRFGSNGLDLAQRHTSEAFAQQILGSLFPNAAYARL